MRSFNKIPLFLFLSAFLSASQCKIKTRDEILNNFYIVDQQIQKLMQDTRVVGLSLVLFKGKEILVEKSYGDAKNNPLFQAASISKPVATFGALKLVEKKKWELEGALSHYVLKPYLPPQEYVDLVTVKTILNHTSGMGEDVDGIDRKIYFKPGTQYSYSGAGFLYLQQAMEDTTGVDFNSYMTPYFKKLGMRTSTYLLDYEGEHYSSAAYSLQSTPQELSLFMDEIASPHPENAWVAMQMTTPTFSLDEDLKWGLGFGLFPCGDEIAIRHTGRNFQYHHSIAVIFNKSRIGAVIMARGKDSRGIPITLAKMAIGGDYGL